MSDTPETDAEVIVCHGIPDGFNPPKSSYVSSNFARKLERERTSAINKIQRQAERIRQLEGATNHAGGTPLSIALKERDEARAEIEGWRNKWECAIAMAAQSQIERDEARSHIAEGWTVKAEDYDALREAAIAFMNKVTSRISLGMLQNIEGEYNQLMKVTYGTD